MDKVVSASNEQTDDASAGARRPTRDRRNHPGPRRSRRKAHRRYYLALRASVFERFGPRPNAVRDDIDTARFNAVEIVRGSKA